MNNIDSIGYEETVVAEVFAEGGVAFNTMTTMASPHVLLF